MSVLPKGDCSWTDCPISRTVECMLPWDARKKGACLVLVTHKHPAGLSEGVTCHVLCMIVTWRMRRGFRQGSKQSCAFLTRPAYRNSLLHVQAYLDFCWRCCLSRHLHRGVGGGGIYPAKGHGEGRPKGFSNGAAILSNGGSLHLLCCPGLHMRYLGCQHYQVSPADGLLTCTRQCTY